MREQQKHSDSIRTWAALFAFGGMLLPAFAQIPMATERFERTGKTDVYGIGEYLHSDDITFNGPAGDVKVKMDDTGLGGFGVAYHFNDFLSLRGDFMFGGANFKADVQTGPASFTEVQHDAFLQTGRLNLDYNIINRRITPFVTVGIGYQYLETELNNAPPVGSCYWDPWWGYVCYYDHPIAWETDFTWNVGAGFRWNITDNLFIKAMVGANWLEYSGAKDITMQIEGIFAIGGTF
jgi:opacity protein-like surface antigen